MTTSARFDTAHTVVPKWHGDDASDNDNDNDNDNGNDYDYEDFDEAWYSDPYDTYDFAIHALRSGGGGRTMSRSNKQTKEKHKGNSKNVYSSKHVRAKEIQRERRKGKKRL